MSQWRLDFLQQLTTPPRNEDEIFGRLAKLAAEHGFEYCSFGLRRPAMDTGTSESWWTTYPGAWQQHYHDNDYLKSDPVIHAAQHSHLPVVWNGDSFEGRRGFWESAHGHGIRHGWTLALHGAHGELALISLARSHARIREPELDSNEAKLLWLSHAALEALTLRNKHPPDSDVRHAVSLRERDILRWALAGKTAEETAAILGITTRTVDFHMMEIMQKLNVVNKTQAVAKALVLGLLG